MVKKQDKDPDRLVATLSVGELRDLLMEQPRILGSSANLLTPKELAEKLAVPVSWVYERSRLKKIPTHRVGKYTRFNLAEVLESEARRKANGEAS